MGKFAFENWRETYKEKEIQPEGLIEIIESGSRIFFGSGVSEPLVLTGELEKAKWRFHDCEIVHFFSLSDRKFFDDTNPSNFRHNTLSIIGSPIIREAIKEGKSDFTPIMSSEIPRMLAGMRNRIIVDVAMIQVSPPDQNGYCSLGTNVDINKTMVEVAKTVIAQINPQMPRTMGNSFIKFSEIDHFVYHDSPLIEYTPYKFDRSPETPEQHAQNEKIAEYVSRLIENESTLNLGLGKIPYLLPKYLMDKKNLAIYSEVLPESIIPLIENDVVTCSKNYYPHCMTSMIVGTDKFYKFVANNPFIEFQSTAFITNLIRISRNNKLCSVYGAMKVDLIGQATNHLKFTAFEGMGGEADFMHGSNLSARGRCIIALPSTTKSGKSRILPILTYEPINLRTVDVHYVITEYGIAYLRGKSVRERILQMIGIAHPNYRQELLETAKQYNYVYKDQRLPTTNDGVVIIYPDIFWEFHTSEKETIFFRPVKPTDERMVQEFYYRLSPEDRILRFFTFQKKFSHKQTQSQIMCDYQNSMVIIGFYGHEEDERVVSIGTYFLHKDTGLVEIALTVEEEFRGQGIARHILLKLIEMAQQKGFIGMCGDVLISNKPMMHLLKSLPYNTVFRGSGESLEFYLKFAELNPSYKKGKKK
ncbi:butyrate:acetyl-CoA coenzyme A-transferase [Candidatus Lokiarchaeum ossiferum]|uniref:Butyrate:acetyl-CoA coenzyme A-transferase n=1 Tax=Candidatus Lokiarchaeum ossiferum TaxID=2951803 RepID=A0ABY6HRH6_9ARCH|nr:butyrate:acetyl-CoA coenzyme A-transferase [Candidatus Lokiarchaeum sp. B-35]